MALQDTIKTLEERSNAFGKKVGEAVSDKIFKMRNSKVAEKYSRYADMLLYSRDTSKRMEDIKDRFYYPTKPNTQNSVSKGYIYTNDYAKHNKPSHVQREEAFKKYLRDYTLGKAPSYAQILGKEPWKKDKATGDYYFMNKPPGQQIMKDRRGNTPPQPITNTPRQVPQQPTFTPDRSFTANSTAPTRTIDAINKGNESNSDGNTINSDKIVKALNDNHSEMMVKYKITTTHLNMQTELLKKIEINTRNSGEMLDLLKKQTKARRTPNRSKPPKTPPGGNTGITAEKRIPQSKPTPLKERAKNTMRRGKSIAKSGGLKAMQKLATGAGGGVLARGALSAGARLGVGVLAAGAGPVIGGVLGAAATGVGVGTLISKALPDGLNQAIGKGVATMASAFGSDTASEAITTQEKSDSGASFSKVQVEKVDNVIIPKDNNVKQALENAAKMFNIPKEEMYATAKQESGFNPRAVNKKEGADAVGLFQFMPGTWNGLLKQNPEIAKQYNIGKAFGKNLDDRTDPYKAAIMYGLYRKGNVGYLEKRGLTSGNKQVDSYLAHFLGAGGAARVLQALSNGKGNYPISNYVNANQYKLNPELMQGEDGKPRSINDFLKAIANKSSVQAQAYKKTFDKNPALATPSEAANTTPTDASGDAKANTTPVAAGTPSKAANTTPTDASGDAKAANTTPVATGTPSKAANATPMNVDAIKSGDTKDKASAPQISTAPVSKDAPNKDVVEMVTVPSKEPTTDKTGFLPASSQYNLQALDANKSMVVEDSSDKGLFKQPQPKNATATQQQLTNALDSKPTTTSTMGTPQNTVGVMTPASNSNGGSQSSNNVKAVGENVPMPVREITSTVQRILDKEYMRAI
ncbi:MAG: hypothetical protein E6R13_01035 [Spirochaetes bacterium]|nr:MAG: hypothetical protein E6R13_01035 [Spirochaetota bacterium]